MLLEIAIGDAYGMGFEFAKPEALAARVNDGRTYAPHPFHDIKPGCYTDDTQMSLAVAEVTLTQGAEATEEDFAAAFVQAYRRDPRLGYSSGFQSLLSEVRTGAELLARLQPQSIGAGSAMRACPIGYLEDPADVLRIAELQARITHDTAEGVDAAQGVAMMIHLALKRGPEVRGDLRQELRGLSPLLDQMLSAPWRARVPNEGIPALNAALTVIEEAQDMTDAAIRSVSIGGDVDTVGAIALGALSLLLPEADRALPAELIDGLEDGSFGRGYLAALDEKLSSKMESLFPEM